MICDWPGKVELTRGFAPWLADASVSPTEAEATVTITTEATTCVPSSWIEIIEVAGSNGPILFGLDHGRPASRFALLKMRQRLERDAGDRHGVEVYMSSDPQPRVVSCGELKRPVSPTIFEPLSFLGRSALLVRPKTTEPLVRIRAMLFDTDPAFGTAAIPRLQRQFGLVGQLFADFGGYSTLQFVGELEACTELFDAAIAGGADCV